MRRRRNTPPDDIYNDTSEFNSSILLQTILLTTRMLKNQWRNTAYMYSKIWVHVISAILVGFTFFDLGTTPQELQNRAFSVYFILFLCNAIQFREGPSRAYGWIAFASSTILSEIPGAVLVTVVYFLLWYFPSGLPQSEAGYIFLFLLTYEIFQGKVLLGLFMMALSPDLSIASNILVFIVFTFNWFNGIIVPYDQIQVFWRYWLYYLSPFTYHLGGMVTAVTSQTTITCTGSDLAIFHPPPNSTCGSYGSSLISSVQAQLLNPNATEGCQACRWQTGEQWLEQFSLDGGGPFGGKWGAWGVFVGFTVLNLGLVYFFTWVTKVKRWRVFWFFEWGFLCRVVVEEAGLDRWMDGWMGVGRGNT
ncbi:ABC-2 type transporter-domain-containing protein [Aspergillus crustosus]